MFANINVLTDYYYIYLWTYSSQLQHRIRSIYIDHVGCKIGVIYFQKFISWIYPPPSRKNYTIQTYTDVHVQ